MFSKCSLGRWFSPGLLWGGRLSWGPAWLGWTRDIGRDLKGLAPGKVGLQGCELQTPESGGATFKERLWLGAGCRNSFKGGEEGA